ncbi:MAG: hypothetical protein EB090_05915 [Verrucomicrobia bacterium]|nr:hypothetical protein [Verrucomicrobiota bacterium]
MKRVVITCLTAPGGKRRLAEEALRLAAGLSATGRFRIDFVLLGGGLLLLQPEFSGSTLAWDSLRAPDTKIWVPEGQRGAEAGPHLETLPAKPFDEFTLGADLVLRF